MHGRANHGWVLYLILALLASPAIYFIGFGPACWAADRELLNSNPLGVVYDRLYGPLISRLQERDDTRPAIVLTWWAGLGGPGSDGKPLWYWEKERYGGKRPILDPLWW